MKQMKHRIHNITNYQKPSANQKRKGIALFILIAIVLMFFAPALSTYASNDDFYTWNPSSERIINVDLSAHFDGYEGCFVLYTAQTDSWIIYNLDQATLRVAPNSTYKVYDALLGLEEGIITPEDNTMEWNQTVYPFEEWNADQTLKSAISSSVNWYFQSLDKQLGKNRISQFFHQIGYGNQDISGDISSYWMESSLKISAIEQVNLLVSLYNNDFKMTPENVDAVKNALYLSTSESQKLYGKTGTGRIDGQDTNGWFIGFTENTSTDNTCFFATNISSKQDATGSKAAEITLELLSEIKLTGY